MGQIFWVVTLDTGKFREQISNGLIITSVVISMLAWLTFYVLRSIGLFMLARRQKLRLAWFAFLPCLWLYTACELISDTNFFGLSFKKLAIWFTIIFAVGEVLGFTYSFIKWFPYIGYYLQGGTIEFINTQQGILVHPGADFINPFLSPESVFMVTISIISNIISFIVLFITISMYINLFKKFWPQHYVLASVFSFLGLFGPFVFAIRNRSAIKYSDYLRQQYGRMYGNYNNPYNPYYGQNPGPNAQRPPETPFSEFAERGEKDPGDPFSEFGDKDDENKNK